MCDRLNEWGKGSPVARRSKRFSRRTANSSGEEKLTHGSYYTNRWLKRKAVIRYTRRDGETIKMDEENGSYHDGCRSGWVMIAFIYAQFINFIGGIPEIRVPQVVGMAEDAVAY